MKAGLIIMPVAMVYFLIYVDDEKFELCTINPGFILGPILQGTLCTSMEVR